MAVEEVTACTVGDVAAPGRNGLVGGPFGSNLVSRDYVAHGVPVIRGTNMGHGRWVGGEFVFVTPEKADSLSANLARPGDIVFTQRGTLGQVALIPDRGFERYLISQSQMKLTANPNKACAQFLYYVFTSAEQLAYIRQNAIQTGVPHTNLGILRGTPLGLPSLATQKAIAHILGSLDDKIELNRRTNETLEAMARALFKSWFVDFDPVRAKADGRQPSGMDVDTAKLFPSDLIESELGPIPKGWRIAKLGDVLELKRGYDLPAAQRQAGTVPIISSSGPSGLHSEAKASAPGIVTGRYGTIGLVFYVREDFWPLNTTLYVRNFKGTDVLYAYHLLRLIDFRKFSDKAAVPGVNRNHLHEEAVVAPPLAVQQRFTSLASAWLDLAAQSTDQTRVLTAVRDALLPRLLSGEMTVASAERAVGDVA